MEEQLFDIAETNGAETEKHDNALREMLTLLFAQFRKRFGKSTRHVAT